MNMYRVVKIEKIKDEAKGIKTFRFHDSHKVEPGQFYMIWLPGVDEFPMSVSYVHDLKGVTVKKIGKGTEKMHGMKEGDKLWIRGPYGHGFKVEKGKALVVGGGSGMATLAPLIEKLKDYEVIIAARNKEELLFTERFKDVKIATDDGSLGYHGFATELAEIMLEENTYDVIYTCGPEPMMAKMVEIAKKRGIKIQASLERFMKCGIGICDSCSINGYRVCVDGPVFSSPLLFEMDELGKEKRRPSGLKVKI